MKKTRISKIQKEIINKHKHLTSHFKIDSDGKTVYAKCTDGYVKIKAKE